jgi:hypothetical protein
MKLGLRTSTKVCIHFAQTQDKKQLKTRWHKTKTTQDKMAQDKNNSRQDDTRQKQLKTKWHKTIKIYVLSPNSPTPAMG